jgi:hypothetical protein
MKKMVPSSKRYPSMQSLSENPLGLARFVDVVSAGHSKMSGFCLNM